MVFTWFLEKMSYRPIKTILPKISLIIPVKNEVRTLPRLLRNIQEQSVAVNEIVITELVPKDGNTLLINRLIQKCPLT
jgi:4,4'-diaponeurosporenoate glycosyltransferase